MLLIAVTSFGCGNKAAAPEGGLRQAFAQAPDAVRRQAAKADAALRATNYLECLTTLDLMLSQDTLSENQKSAVKQVFGQVSKAVNKNPTLDSPKLFKARSDLMQKLYGPR